MKKITILISLILPLTLFAQEYTTEQIWNKELSSASNIIEIYQQISKTKGITEYDNYYFILKSGEYIVQTQGKNQDIILLLKQTPDIDLNSPTIKDFIESRRTNAQLVDYYFMIQELKKGITFNEARDGISPSTQFNNRPLNSGDYTKLKAIFSQKNEYLQSIYLEKMKLLFRNDGCTDGILEIKPLIQKSIPESNLKNDILALYNRYEKIRQGQLAPTPILKDASGKEYSFNNFTGKVIVVDIWATWCCVCIEKMPAFMELRNEFRDNANVIFLTVSIDRKKAREKWLKAIEDNNMSGMLNLIPDSDEESPFETAYCIPSVPRYLVIDQEGKIVNAYAPSPGSELKETIINTLNKSQEGTQWQDLSFQDALEKSKATGKKLFIDCYTKTCGPCKYMVKYIFPLKEVGDYFNDNYVCIMKDMEEGDGIDIARKYNVQVYPTYLILNEDGSIYCRLDGGAVSSPEENFVQKVKDAIDLAELNRKYLSGTKDQAFLEKYIHFLQNHDKNQLQKVMSETMPQMGVKKLSEPQNWNLIKNEITNIDTPLFRYLLNNRKGFAKRIGQKEVEEKIMSTYQNEFRVFKMMGIDFEKRMVDLKLLEKDSYPGALPLRYCMLFRHIIDNKLINRVHEIPDALQNEIQSLPSPEDRLNIIKELSGFEQVATPQQKEQVCRYLKEISKNLPSNNTNYIERIIKRLSQN